MAVAADGTLGDAEQEIVLAAFDSNEALASLLGKGTDRPPDPIAIESTGSWPGGVFPVVAVRQPERMTSVPYVVGRNHFGATNDVHSVRG